MTVTNVFQCPGLTRTTFSRNDLAQAFGALGLTRGAEIGVWQGRFSEVLCEANPGVRLLCVDPWQTYDGYTEHKKNNQKRLDEAYREAHRRLDRFGCTLLKATSLEAAKTVEDGSLDFVYIDGNHAEPYVTQDLTAWAPKVRKGGVVSGHDYNEQPKKHLIHVKPAVDAYCAAHGITDVVVFGGDKSPSFAWMVR